MQLLELFRRYHRQAAKVAFVVGTILLVINQHDALLGYEKIQWLPAALTYCVPFCVFMLGKLSSERDCRKSSGLNLPVSRYR
ncbi:nitrate/nitrite transporter NrtS [Marinobacter nauticus]|uniref:nitrate/nitrite transporter NrtS n=1 Tax=Marinobacter nauticus TaxID=2743 RepID=UPI001C589EC2|nr:nitrate/nitrite transporter NrtS [Marinobacter nauticus]MBW3196295.1 nitrate/nitrite transporter NrtS [Marinobacter nauticus]MBY6181705.1 nitrate/nitrite transporter NrtS [Marinobacter nauticus]